jgi:hypothetical protein
MFSFSNIELKQFVRNNVTMASIILFLTIYIAIQVSKPAIFYNIDGSIRDFGVGYKNKTILPIWLLSIILGILSYLVILYYLSYSQFSLHSIM